MNKLAYSVALLFAVLCALSVTLCATPASDARQQSETVMRHYKAAHPDCEACGAKATLLRRMEVHHIVPCATAPQDASNGEYITLCRADHIAYGHCGDGSCRKYCPNIREVLRVRIVKENR